MCTWPSGLSVTAVVVALYAFIFASVLITDHLPTVPTDQGGLNLTQAWKDLHVIATRPHPYNSHANDIVHAFLLSRLEPIASSYPHVHLIEDRLSNGSWGQIYFEGTNILVKVDGTDPNAEGAVLFSAHYDSVSTSTGATDDGMGIVTLIQLVEKLAKTRTKRTAVVNFNNGEEDGLNGAHAFLQHPWSSLTTSFLNLEGAASGGRPILFRGTSNKPLRALLREHVPHPHGNIIAGDAFARGVLRSRTDFIVYSENGNMEGLDLAFYKGRSRYHTKFDAIPFLEGGRKALWNMMETVDGAGRALLDQSKGAQPGDAVYFDLFGRTMIMFSLATMQASNKIFLISAPFVVLLLITLRRLADPGSGSGNILHRLWNGQGSSDFSRAKFWVALMVAVVTQVAVVLGYVKLNAYTIYSSPYLVLLSTIMSPCVAFSVSLSDAFTSPALNRLSVSNSSANPVMLQLLILSYALLLAVNYALPIGGTYLFSFFAGHIFSSWTVGAVHDLLIVSSDIVEGAPEKGSSKAEEHDGTDPTGTTPLILGERPDESINSTMVKVDVGRRQQLWFIQFLIAVPVPVILVSHVAVFLIAMTQSIADGGPVWLGYATFSLVSFLLVLPLVPFLHSYPSLEGSSGPSQSLSKRQLASPLLRFLIVTFLVCTTYAWIKFPFSINAPLKVFFQQRVEIVAPWITVASQGISQDAATGFQVRARTSLTGVPHYVENMIIPALPSAAENVAECIMDKDRSGLARCEWNSGDEMVSFPGQQGVFIDDGIEADSDTLVLARNPWLRSRIKRHSFNRARITIRGTNTRTCRVYFDNAKIAAWSVHGGSSVSQGEKELNMLRLWSRTWEREFVVDIEFFEGTEEKIKGSIACGWSEYESGMVGVPGGQTGQSKIPAFEEVLRFLPKWATVTKLTDGLVEVWSPFEI